MTFPGRPVPVAATADVKVTVPELPEIGAFWVRDYGTHHTFAELYQECVNHPSVVRSLSSLQPAHASRHFWSGASLMPRAASLHSLAAQVTAPAGGRPELSLILRRDLYRLGPPQFVAGGIEYTYIDAEDRIDRVIPIILGKDQNPCCFDLCDWRRRRLAPDKTLADFELWPAWEDAGEFPDRAGLRLRARTGWLAYTLLAIAAVAGLLLGYTFWKIATLGSIT